MGGIHMGNSINFNSVSSRVENRGIQAVCKEENTLNLKISVGTEEQEEGTRDTIVSISREGRLKAANWKNGEKKQKKAGVTSARELFENDTSRLRAEARGHRGNVGVDLLEMMRLDEPESYAKFMELEQKAFELDFFSEEAYVYHRRAIVEVECDWFYRRCFDSLGNLSYPTTGRYAVLDTLEKFYVEGQHETSFNYYAPEFSDDNSELWKYTSKFNVLLPIDMLNDLASVDNLKEAFKDKKNPAYGWLHKINQAVNDIKRVERDYEGDLDHVMLGVKFKNNGQATYHADYRGCKEEGGITADSADELLEKLMNA